MAFLLFLCYSARITRTEAGRQATRRGVNADRHREKHKTQPEAVNLADKQEGKYTAMPAVRGRFVDAVPKRPCGR